MKLEQLLSLDWETLAERLGNQPETIDVYRLADFFDHLLTDVICQQVLPDTVKQVSETFGLSFTFKPIAVVSGDFYSRDIAVSCSHPKFADIRLTYDSPVSNAQLHSTCFNNSPSTMHRMCLLWLSLLRNIFTPAETSANRLWRICIYYDFIKPGCPLADLVTDSPFGTTFYFHLKPFNSPEDLLAGLLAEGYNLTSLQPFMAG